MKNTVIHIESHIVQDSSTNLESENYNNEKKKKKLKYQI